MTLVTACLLAFASVALSVPFQRRAVPSFVFDGDAPFSVDSATLAAAITCPNGSPTSSSPPVLLVHGTSTTGKETWADSYVPALAANGYTACYVTLPNRAMGDMQVSAEYVAYGLHYVSYISDGLQTAVISHSQGGPDTQWALQFWPSTRVVTSSFIPLSPDFAGIKLLDSDLSNVCVGDLCQASLWQQSAGSHFYDALHKSDFQALVPTTAVWSQSDGVVSPFKQNAQLPSADAISVQSLCPGRFVIHTSMTTDAAAFALALDALEHNGDGSLLRVMPHVLSICFRSSAKHMNDNVAATLKADLDDLIDGFLLGNQRVTSEPALMAYAASN